MKYYELWYEFNKTDNAKESLETYVENYEECVKNQLEVISCDKDIALNIPVFEEIININGIKTIFEYPNLSFFSPSIVKNMSNGKRAPLAIDYSISFEVNTASELYKYFDNKNTVDGFVDTLHTFLDRNYNIDPMFYMIENISKGEETADFYKNMFCIKKLMTCDMKHYKKTEREIKSIFSDEEVKLLVQKDIEDLKKKFKSIIEDAQKQHLIMKIILLVIHLGILNHKEEKSFFKYIIKFMDEKLNAIMLREFVIAINYFNFEKEKNKKFKGTNERHKYEIFNKLNVKIKADFFKNINNVAWDFTLVRQLEMYFSSKPNPNADFFIPFLFTYDKGLQEVMKMFYCKDFLIFHKDKRTIPIPNNINTSKFAEYGIEKYFTEQAHINRMDNKNIDYEKIFEELKLKLISKNKKRYNWS